jgi:head-tail adaptor
MKGYSAGLRKDIITIQNRREAVAGEYGIDSAGIQWVNASRDYAAVDWQIGKSALREGAIDAYGVVMVRMNWNPYVTMRSRIVHGGQTYQILPETFHADRQEDTIQFLAQVIID